MLPEQGWTQRLYPQDNNGFAPEVEGGHRAALTAPWTPTFLGLSHFCLHLLPAGPQHLAFFLFPFKLCSFISFPSLLSGLFFLLSLSLFFLKNLIKSQG